MSSESATESVVALEMLLEAYFVVIDSTRNNLASVYTASTKKLLFIFLIFFILSSLLSYKFFVFLISAKGVH